MSNPSANVLSAVNQFLKKEYGFLPKPSDLLIMPPKALIDDPDYNTELLVYMTESPVATAFKATFRYNRLDLSKALAFGLKSLKYVNRYKTHADVIQDIGSKLGYVITTDDISLAGIPWEYQPETWVATAAADSFGWVGTRPFTLTL